MMCRQSPDGYGNSESGNALRFGQEHARRSYIRLIFILSGSGTSLNNYINDYLSMFCFDLSQDCLIPIHSGPHNLQGIHLKIEGAIPLGDLPAEYAPVECGGALRVIGMDLKMNYSGHVAIIGAVGGYRFLLGRRFTQRAGTGGSGTRLARFDWFAPAWQSFNLLWRISSW